MKNKKEKYEKAYIDIYLTQQNSTKSLCRMIFSGMTLEKLNQIMDAFVGVIFYYTKLPESSFTVTGIITDGVLEIGRKQMSTEGER